MKCALLLAACLLYAADPEVLVRQVAVYDFGKDPVPVRELEAFAHSSGPAIEKALLGGLASAKTLAAKDAFCRDLAIAGTRAAVPSLASLLKAPDTAEMARAALERIPAVEAGKALRDALLRTAPPVQTGIVVSLGRRKDAASVTAIQPLLASKDAATADAAAVALARIGTPEARNALLQAAPSPSISNALLSIADAAVYRRLYSAAQNEAIRIAALEGLARTDQTQAATLLQAALKSDSPRLQAAAIRQLARLDPESLAKEIPEAPERARVEILSVLSDAGAPGVRTLLLKSAADSSDAVRVAALTGLSKHGTAGDVSLLAARAAAASGNEQAAARAALGSIHQPGTDAAILQAIPAAEAKVKVELIRAAGERSIGGAGTVLLAAAADVSRPARIESVRALRETAGTKEIRPLLDLLAKTAAENERRELERAVASAIRRSQDAPVDDVMTAYRDASDAGVRVSLLNILSSAGSAASLPLVREALRNSDPDIARGALNALSGWPSPEPSDDLLALARKPGDPARQILALRGYIKLVQLPSNRTPSETARLLKTALETATRPDEKRAVLAVLQRLVCPESLDAAKSVEADAAVAAEARLAIITLERSLSFVK